MQYPHSLIRVAILDDHVIVRHGLSSCLAAEPDITVVGNYESSFKMIAGLAAAPADVLLVDYSLGPDQVDGVSLIRALGLPPIPWCAWRSTLHGNPFSTLRTGRTPAWRQSTFPLSNARPA